MVELKTYGRISSISDLPLSFPISTFNINFRQHNPTFVRFPHFHPTPSHRLILFAGRRGWSQLSNRKMLQLASIVALNLKILPEPLNSLVDRIVRGESNEHQILNLVGDGRKGKRKKRGAMFMWLAFVLIPVTGLWLWRVLELELFLRLLFLYVIVISLWWGNNKAIKEWFLGFLAGLVLMMSFRIAKKDVSFWVQKLRICSPVAQIVMRNRRN